jgi:hypothetical protein
MLAALNALKSKLDNLWNVTKVLQFREKLLVNTL